MDIAGFPIAHLPGKYGNYIECSICPIHRLSISVNSLELKLKKGQATISMDSIDFPILAPILREHVDVIFPKYRATNKKLCTGCWV